MMSLKNLPQQFTFIPQELFIPLILQLPHPSSIREWTLTINCEPGFFTEVFSDLQKKSSNFQRLHRMLPYDTWNGNKETNDL